MHSCIHNGRFINHLWLIVEVNGAGHEACVREQTIKLLSFIIKNLHIDEHKKVRILSTQIYVFVHIISMESTHGFIINVACVLPLTDEKHQWHLMSAYGEQQFSV